MLLLLWWQERSYDLGGENTKLLSRKLDRTGGKLHSFLAFLIESYSWKRGKGIDRRSQTVPLHLDLRRRFKRES